MSKNTEFEYPVIDLKKTGEWLRYLCKFYGYSVKDLQECLHISSNQAIYEWFNGHTLPSINNLLALSNLLKVPINMLLVDDTHEAIYRCKNDSETYFRQCRRYFILGNNVVRMEKSES